jgi:hypothetical protein
MAVYLSKMCIIKLVRRTRHYGVHFVVIRILLPCLGEVCKGPKTESQFYPILVLALSNTPSRDILYPVGNYLLTGAHQELPPSLS